MSPTAIDSNSVNRANAQHSCGPRTAQGKLAASKNAIKHGLYAREAFLPGEDPEEYDALGLDLTNRYMPANADEEILVKTLQDSRWRLDRCAYLEDAFWFATAEEEVSRAQALLKVPDDPDAPLPANVLGLAHFLGFRANEGTFEKILRQEGRLRRLIEKTTADLNKILNAREMRKRIARQSAPPPIPTPQAIVEDEPETFDRNDAAPEIAEPQEKVQNEPILLAKIKIPKFTGRRADRKRREWILKNAPHLLQAA